MERGKSEMRALACMRFLTTRETAWYIISVASVSMYVCLSEDNFRKPQRRKFIFEHPVYLDGIRVKFVYEGHRVKVKVTGTKNVRKFLFPQCTTSIGKNSGSMKHRAVKFAYSMGFSVMADQIV